MVVEGRFWSDVVCVFVVVRVCDSVDQLPPFFVEIDAANYGLKVKAVVF